MICGWKRKAGCEENCVSEVWVTHVGKEERLHMKPRRPSEAGVLHVEERHLGRVEG